MADGARRRVVYHGRVQGVGFRAAVQGIAARFAVTGFVRNLPDGTVELVADGSGSELGSFLAAVADRFSRHVTKAEAHPAYSAEAFAGFSIRR